VTPVVPKYPLSHAPHIMGVKTGSIWCKQGSRGGSILLKWGQIEGVNLRGSRGGLEGGISNLGGSQGVHRGYAVRYRENTVIQSYSTAVQYSTAYCTAYCTTVLLYYYCLLYSGDTWPCRSQSWIAGPPGPRGGLHQELPPNSPFGDSLGT
jgi:hypothetical protein